jgi:hypothetical protein
MGSVTLEVLKPTGSHVTEDGSAAAPRVDTLDDKRIGLVWNNKDYGDKLLDEVKKMLQERYTAAQFSTWRLRECCAPPPEGELERIAGEVDAVVYGLGD